MFTWNESRQVHHHWLHISLTCGAGAFDCDLGWNLNWACVECVVRGRGRWLVTHMSWRSQRAPRWSLWCMRRWLWRCTQCRRAGWGSEWCSRLHPQTSQGRAPGLWEGVVQKRSEVKYLITKLQSQSPAPGSCLSVCSVCSFPPPKEAIFSLLWPDIHV